MANYALSAYSRENLMKVLYYNTAMPTKPTAWYISLHTAEPDVTTGSNEHTATFDYARKEFTPDTITASPEFMASNDAVEEFAAANGGDWTQVTYFGIWDAVTGGNFLGHGVLTTPRTVLDGGIFRVPIGELDIKLV